MKNEASAKIIERFILIWGLKIAFLRDISFLKSQFVPLPFQRPLKNHGRGNSKYTGFELVFCFDSM